MRSFLSKILFIALPVLLVATGLFFAEQVPSNSTFSKIAHSVFVPQIAEAVCYDPNQPDGRCIGRDGVCGATHYNCQVGASMSNVQTSTGWTWVCRGTTPLGGVSGANDYCSETIQYPAPTLTATPGSAYAGATINVAWSAPQYAYCKVNVYQGTMWYREWYGASGSFTFTMPGELFGGSPTFELWCGPNATSISKILSASVLEIIDGRCGWTNNMCAAGALTDTPDSATQYLWTCGGTNGGSPTACALDKPVNGYCGPARSCPQPSALQSYIGGYCESYTPYECSKGVSSNQVSGATQWTWVCAGTGGGTNDSCSRSKPIDAVCGITHYNCAAGLPYYGKYGPEGTIDNTPPTAWDTSTQWIWECLGPNGGISQTCSENKPVDGSCASAHYSCTSGASINGYDAGDRWLWDCEGSFGGTTALGCSQMKPINGICAQTHYSCNVGTSAQNVDGATKWTWSCFGQNGGTNATCAENKIPVNGVCGATHYSCVAGNAVNNFYDGAYAYSWNCNGANGGTNVSCSENVTPPPVNGVCATTHYSCAAGVSIGGYDAGASWNWNCAGQNGGTTPSCIEYKPFNGVCGDQHYSCATGTSVQNTDGANRWTWTCNGGYGGTAANCAENKPPVITWSPAVGPTIDYHTKVSYSYTTTNAVSCDYDEIDASGNVVKNIWKDGPANAPWSGPQGEYDQDVRRRLTCRNSDGKRSTSDYHITVRQNDASCGTFTAPAYLLPGEVFTPTLRMNNTGANTWTHTVDANYVLSRNDNVWSRNSIELVAAPVVGGSAGIFTGSLTAPNIENDYDFTWSMRPIFGGAWWPSFGPSCGVTTANSNKIRVKQATLGINPESYQFSDTVVGDSPSTVSVHVQNLGGGTITGITLGAIAPPFSCISNCDLGLSAGGIADITLAFTPTATGTFSQNASVSNKNTNPIVPIVDSISGLPVDHIYIYGNATDKFTVSTDVAGLNTISSVQFGDVAWTTAKYVNLTIHNRSKEKSGAINPTVDGNSAFSCVSGCSPGVIAPGAARGIRLKFLPPTKQDQVYDGVLRLGASSATVLGVSGRGVKPEFSVEEK